MSVQVHKVKGRYVKATFVWPTWGQSYHTYVSSSFVLDSNRGSYSIFGMIQGSKVGYCPSLWTPVDTCGVVKLQSCWMHVQNAHIRT
jgi:hypothetical protein